MTQRVLQFEESVSSWIEALLAKCDRIRRGADVGRPIVFDRRGEQHARAVARRDAQSTPKPVDTALPPTIAAGHRTATAANSSLPGPLAEPVTGALSRLRPREDR